MTSKAFLIPLYLSFQIIFGPFLLYAITLSYQHLENAIPFISDTGMRAPEAPIFTILFNLGAFLVFLTVYIRHHIFDMKYQNGFQKPCYTDSASSPTKRMNLWSYVCGLFTVLGLLIIGNFRSSEMNGIHNFGTYITCVFGTFDIILQSRIAFNTNSKKIAILRLIIVSVIIPSFLGYIFIEFINKKIWKNVYVRDSLGKSVAAVCEWIGFCMFGPFYATYIPEFRRLRSIQIVVDFSDPEKQLMFAKEVEVSDQ